MPMNRADYPPDWDDISRQIRAQAGDRCEFCGVANRAVGARDRLGQWWSEERIRGMNYDVGYGLFNGEFPRIIRVVLTVAHLCHDTTCRDPTHLRALCQKCHLAYDAERHRATAAETVRRKRAARVAATGQLGMVLTGEEAAP